MDGAAGLRMGKQRSSVLFTALYFAGWEDETRPRLAPGSRSPEERSINLLQYKGEAMFVPVEQFGKREARIRQENVSSWVIAQKTYMEVTIARRRQGSLHRVA
jgi:hypothetical protein